MWNLNKFSGQEYDFVAARRADASIGPYKSGSYGEAAEPLRPRKLGQLPTS